MIRNFFVIAGLLIAGMSTAQPPGGKPPAIEDRLKHTNEIIGKEIKPTASQKAAIDEAFKNFFERADKLRKDNPPPPPPPPDPKVKAELDKLVKERDEKIRKVLTAEQFSKYQEAAKKLMPPPPGHEKEKDAPLPPKQ